MTMMPTLQFRLRGGPEVIQSTDDQIDYLQSELSYRIQEEARALMDDTKHGRVYRRAAITGRRTVQGINAGLRPSGRASMIIGYSFHRASRSGESIAQDSGDSYRDITVTRMARGTYRIRFGGWTGFWEFDVPVEMQRPTIMPAIEKAVQKTFRNFL